MPRVFIDGVNEWEDIRIAPSRFDSTVREIHHRQVYLERVHLHEMVGCETGIGARRRTSYLEFSHHLFSDFPRDVEALQRILDPHQPCSIRVSGFGRVDVQVDG